MFSSFASNILSRFIYGLFAVPTSEGTETEGLTHPPPPPPPRGRRAGKESPDRRRWRVPNGYRRRGRGWWPQVHRCEPTSRDCWRWPWQSAGQRLTVAGRTIGRESFSFPCFFVLVRYKSTQKDGKWPLFFTQINKFVHFWAKFLK